MNKRNSYGYSPIKNSFMIVRIPATATPIRKLPSKYTSLTDTLRNPFHKTKLILSHRKVLTTSTFSKYFRTKKYYN